MDKKNSIEKDFSNLKKDLKNLKKDVIFIKNEIKNQRGFNEEFLSEIKKISKISDKMDSHINFIDDTHLKLTPVLNFLSSKIDAVQNIYLENEKNFSSEEKPFYFSFSVKKFLILICVYALCYAINAYRSNSSY
jgi:uncharacterized coiled-coil DUF342 family protein